MIYLRADIVDTSNGQKRAEYCMCEETKIEQGAPLFNEKMKLNQTETASLSVMEYDDWAKVSNNVGWLL